MKLLSKFFLLLGLTFLLFGAYLLYLRHSPRILTFNYAPTAVSSLSFTSPANIEIPSIGVNLPVIPAVIHGTSWETTSRGVSYLSSTPAPGKKGNSVMYAHNWESLLGHLPQVKPGQNIIVVSKSHERKVFRVEYTAIVSPSQTYIIDNTNDTRLTIYTCTGFLDSKRFVVVAKPIS